MLVALLLACASEPSAVVEQVPVAEEAPPAGRIGGTPILDKPVVLGGIDGKAVDEGIAAQQPAIDRCWNDAGTTRTGKVLVSFTIARDGTVAGSRTQATSLRDEAVEACVNRRVEQARFPELERGSSALVRYPFSFPPKPATTPR